MPKDPLSLEVHPALAFDSIAQVAQESQEPLQLLRLLHAWESYPQIMTLALTVSMRETLLRVHL